jgi:hypothetical protein
MIGGIRPSPVRLQNRLHHAQVRDVIERLRALVNAVLPL